MANRMYFVSQPATNRVFEERNCIFDYHKGFSISQKQKCIQSMHNSIIDSDPSLRLLEISTKSMQPLGVALSAFNLELCNKSEGKKLRLENVFQSSKVFEYGGPFLDLLNISPKEAKRDERLINSGELTHFAYDNKVWPIEPKTMFYDWIYIAALNSYKELAELILNYDAFTDIEFNHKRSFNCQARSASIYVSLKKSGLVEDYLSDMEKFKLIYSELNESEQITMF